MQDDAKLVQQLARRLNPTMREIVNEEIQKLFKVRFFYPIFDSEWVSPLVVVLKKNGKWRICIDYRELNKATRKDHFPLPYIDQVLDNLSSNKYFSFLYGFNGYNQIQVSQSNQDKTTFTCILGTYAYKVLPFGLCNAPTIFQRAILNIFCDLSYCVEVYMDEFTYFSEIFYEALKNLEKLLNKCKDTNLSLSNDKYHLMMIEGIVLGHHVSAQVLKVNINKIEVI